MLQRGYRKVRWLIRVIVTIIITGFCVEWYADSFKLELDKYLGSYLQYLLVAILIGFFYFEWTIRNKEGEKKKKRPFNESLRQKFLKGTLSRFESRRKQKLNFDLSFEIDLLLKYVKTTAKDPIHKQFLIKPDKSSIASYQELFDDYYHHIKRLLILGNAGSGKTLLLLRLGEYLIEKAKADPQHPIPVIINLANWRSYHDSFVEWLKGQVSHAIGEAGTSMERAEELVDNFQILPLLDGLDEVPQDHQKSCLAAIEAYLDNRTRQYPLAAAYPQVVICCRKVEFAQLASSAPVFASIEIKPLSQKAVRQTLQQLKTEKKDVAASRLLQAFDHAPVFRQALDTAFYIHTSLSLYSAQEQLNFSLQPNHTPQTLQAELTERYLQQQLQQLEQQTTYSGRRAKKYLSWLASRLSTIKKGVSFELADLQLDWVSSNKRNKIYYGLVYGSVYGLFFGLVGGLTFGLFSGLVVGLAFLLIMGSVGGLAFGFDRIIYPDIVQIHFSRFNWYFIIQGLGVGLVSGLVIGLVIGLVNGLVIWLITGLVIGLVGGLTNAIVSSKDFPKIKNSYQRVTSDLLTAIVQYGLSGLCIALLLRLQPFDQGWRDIFASLSYWETAGLGTLLGSALSIFYTSFFRFCTLYLLLLFKRLIPLNLVRFLNRVTDHTGLMERDGGQWRFRHQLIQDALAAAWDLQEGKDKKE